MAFQQSYPTPVAFGEETVKECTCGQVTYAWMSTFGCVPPAYIVQT